MSATSAPSASAPRPLPNTRTIGRRNLFATFGVPAGLMIALLAVISQEPEPAPRRAGPAVSAPPPAVTAAPPTPVEVKGALERLAALEARVRQGAGASRVDDAVAIHREATSIAGLVPAPEVTARAEAVRRSAQGRLDAEVAALLRRGAEEEAAGREWNAQQMYRDHLRRSGEGLSSARRVEEAFRRAGGRVQLRLAEDLLVLDRLVHSGDLAGARALVETIAGYGGPAARGAALERAGPSLALAGPPPGAEPASPTVTPDTGATTTPDTGATTTPDTGATTTPDTGAPAATNGATTTPDTGAQAATNGAPAATNGAPAATNGAPAATNGASGSDAERLARLLGCTAEPAGADGVVRLAWAFDAASELEDWPPTTQALSGGLQPAHVAPLDPDPAWRVDGGALVFTGWSRRQLVIDFAPDRPLRIELDAPRSRTALVAVGVLTGRQLVSGAGLTIDLPLDRLEVRPPWLEPLVLRSRQRGPIDGLLRERSFLELEEHFARDSRAAAAGRIVVTVTPADGGKHAVALEVAGASVGQALVELDEGPLRVALLALGQVSVLDGVTVTGTPSADIRQVLPALADAAGAEPAAARQALRDWLATRRPVIRIR